MSHEPYYETYHGTTLNGNPVDLKKLVGFRAEDTPNGLILTPYTVEWRIEHDGFGIAAKEVDGWIVAVDGSIRAIVSSHAD